jgi:hypothetical protein
MWHRAPVPCQRHFRNHSSARSHRTAPGRRGVSAGGGEEHEQRRRGPVHVHGSLVGSGVTARPLARLAPTARSARSRAALPSFAAKPARLGGGPSRDFQASRTTSEGRAKTLFESPAYPLPRSRIPQKTRNRPPFLAVRVVSAVVPDRDTSVCQEAPPRPKPRSQRCNSQAGVLQDALRSLKNASRRQRRM